MELGDGVEHALKLVGITEERVRTVFKDCCCSERKERLNQLSVWSKRILAGKTKHALKYFEELTGD